MCGAERGMTILEVVFTIALLCSLTAIAVSQSSEVIDRARSATAARYVSSLIAGARMTAVTRSASVALRFEESGGDYYFGTVLDGNGNGVRTADLNRGIDRALTRPERLQDKFPGVSFAIRDGVPDLDGADGGLRDGVRIGTARILTLTPNGTATSGTLYICGRGGQYAVRVLGATGRTRVLEYRAGDRTWVAY